MPGSGRCRVGPALAGMVRACPLHSETFGCRPRTRGDGPPNVVTVEVIAMSAPHSRGWSDPAVRLRRIALVGPALAGMVPAATPRWRSCPGRPRTRGDGPWLEDIVPTVQTSAPHSRGWSFLNGEQRVAFTVGPALAGMVRSPTDARSSSKSRPRTRGDGPLIVAIALPLAMSAPHSRGWSSVYPGDWIVQRVGPALAGMVLAGRARPDRTAGRPRTRGDGPAWNAAAKFLPGSAPHSRGWSGRPWRRAARSHVGPALAGMVRRIRTSRPAASCRPRTRGDRPSGRARRHPDRRSAPHSRGWSAGVVAHRAYPLVGPALAGMVHGPGQAAPDQGGRPRTRGDGPIAAEAMQGSRWSAPHSRGWSVPQHDAVLVEDVGPALAGMVRPSAGGTVPRLSRPRTRGDGPWPGLGGGLVGMSAPHSRGWSRRGATTTGRRGSAPHSRGWSAVDSRLAAELVVGPALAGRSVAGERHRGSWQVGPAFAGMLLGGTATPRGLRGWPRTRGDGPAKDAIRCALKRSAPYPRELSEAVRPGHRTAPVGPAQRDGRYLCVWVDNAGARHGCADTPGGCVRLSAEKEGRPPRDILA